MSFEHYEEGRERELREALDKLADEVVASKKVMKLDPEDNVTRELVKQMIKRMKTMVYELYANNPGCGFYSKFLSENHTASRQEWKNPETRERMEKINIIKDAIRAGKREIEMKYMQEAVSEDE